MTDELTTDPENSGVSPLRKNISRGILILLLVVLGIELRAGIGHMQSGKALQNAAPDGAFEKITLQELENLLVLSPSRTVVRESPEDIEYRYGWYSLLRPLLSRPEAAYYVVVSDIKKGLVGRYSPEPPTEDEIAASEALAEAAKRDVSQREPEVTEAGIRMEGGTTPPSMERRRPVMDDADDSTEPGTAGEADTTEPAPGGEAQPEN